MTVGNTIGCHLDRIGMSQAELARRLGVSEKTLWTWLTDRNSPKLRYARQMAEIFGITLDELAGEDEADADKRLDYIISVYGRLNEDGREYLAEQADFAVSRSAFREKSNSNVEVIA